MTLQQIYDACGVASEDFKTRRAEVVRRRHAARIISRENEYTFIEITEFERKVYGATTHHSTVMWSCSINVLTDMPLLKIIQYAKSVLQSNP